MKNAHRNMILAAAAALTLAVAPSALADVRVHVNLPLPPAPHKVLRHLPVPPLPVVVDDDRVSLACEPLGRPEVQLLDDDEVAAVTALVASAVVGRFGDRNSFLVGLRLSGCRRACSVNLG